jgi:hypothetical protein
MLSEKKKIEFYIFACKEGLIIHNLAYKKESYQFQKLRQYIRKGYRIKDYGSEFEVINIFEEELNVNIVRNIQNMYLALL